MKMPKLKAPKIKMLKPSKQIRAALRKTDKASRHLPTKEVIIHAVGHVAGHILVDGMTSQ